MKNPQTTFALTFLTHIIARIGGVAVGYSNFCLLVAACALLSTFVGFSRANVNYISILHVELFYFLCSLLFLVVHFSKGEKKMKPK